MLFFRLELSAFYNSKRYQTGALEHVGRWHHSTAARGKMEDFRQGECSGVSKFESKLLNMNQEGGTLVW